MLLRVYSEQYGLVRGQDEEKSWFRIISGVKQGDPLSGCIFALVISDLLVELDEDWQRRSFGISVVLERSAFLAYHDDVVLFAGSRTQTAYMIDTLCSAASSGGLLINWLKARILHLGGRPNWSIGIKDNGRDVAIPVGTSVKILGRTFREGGGGNEFVRERIVKAWNAFCANRGILLDLRIPYERRARHLCKTVAPVLFFGLESSELQVGQLRKIRTTRRSMMRNIWGRVWREEGIFAMESF